MVTMNFWYLIGALSLVLLSAAVIAQDDLELRVEVLEATVVQINDDVEDVEGVANQNTGQIFEVINDVDDIDDLTDAQEVRIGALEEENSLLRAELDELKLVVSSLSGGLQVLNETVSDLDIDNSTNERLDALENDVTALNETISDLDIGSNNATNERLDALESDVTDLEGDVTSLENIVTTQGTNITRLEDDLTDLDMSTDQRLDDLEENNGTGLDYSDTAFLATHSEYTFVPTDPIVFNLPIINPGSHYNPASGIYTVPLDGIYQFVMHYKNYNDDSSVVYIQVDNVKTVKLYNYDDAYTYHTAEMTILLSLTSGQQVWLSPSDITAMYGTSTIGIFYSWFSGHLMYPL